MGARANIVVVENGAHELYYCHWCASTLPRDLFWGSEYAVAFARQQASVDTPGMAAVVRQPDQVGAPKHRQPVAATEGWLDDVWSEGGGVIDLDRAVLVLFGGDDIRRDVRIRRLYLALIQEVWTGWDVRWAHRGIVDLADHVGVPRSVVVTESEPWVVPLCSNEELVRIDGIASIAFDDGNTQLYPMKCPADSLLSLGRRLVADARGVSGYDQVNLEDKTYEFPTSGFHIDVRQRTVGYWTTRDPSGVAGADLATLWPGWRLSWYRDRFEKQFDRLGDRVRLPRASPEALMADLQLELLSEYDGKPSDAFFATVLKLVKELHGTPTLNPFSRRSDPLHLSLKDRERIFDRAVISWQTRRRA